MVPPLHTSEGVSGAGGTASRKQLIVMYWAVSILVALYDWECPKTETERTMSTKETHVDGRV